MSHNGGRKVIGVLLPEAVTSLRIGQLPIGTMIGQVPLGTIIGGAALAGVGHRHLREPLDRHLDPFHHTSKHALHHSANHLSPGLLCTRWTEVTIEWLLRTYVATSTYVSEAFSDLRHLLIY